jgi:serine/threonine protein phosphatase PrpC
MYFSPPASTEDELQQVLAGSGGDLQGGLDRLVDLALQRGGRDNITAAAIRVDSESSEAEHDGDDAVVSATPTDETVRFSNPLLGRSDE